MLGLVEQALAAVAVPAAAAALVPMAYLFQVPTGQSSSAGYCQRKYTGSNHHNTQSGLSVRTFQAMASSSEHGNSNYPFQHRILLR